MLGFRLPIDGLADWVQGKPSPALESRGWKVEYQEYDAQRRPDAAARSPIRASSCGWRYRSGTDLVPGAGQAQPLPARARRAGADGYHELQTVFRLIDRCDRVGIAPRDGRRRSRFDGPFGEDNLCVRAARLLQAQTGSGKGCDLALEKNLPVGGGLGGGSSDAATVLLVLNRLWASEPDARSSCMQLGAAAGRRRAVLHLRAETPSARASASGLRRSICRPPGTSS